jgi:prepilin-type N-terminal cleavage/methylation domain-containing protein
MVRNEASRRGFSLLELLAVVTILGIIAALLLPRVITNNDMAKEKTCAHNRTEINISVERYYIHNSVWPANDLSDIGADPDYFPDGMPTCPVSGALYQLDGATHRVQGHTGPGDHSP